MRGLSAVTPSINVTGGGGLNQVFIEPIEMKKSEAFYGIKKNNGTNHILDVIFFAFFFSPPPPPDMILCVCHGGGGGIYCALLKKMLKNLKIFLLINNEFNELYLTL